MGAVPARVFTRSGARLGSAWISILERVSDKKSVNGERRSQDNSKVLFYLNDWINKFITLDTKTQIVGSGRSNRQPWTHREASAPLRKGPSQSWGGRG